MGSCSICSVVPARWELLRTSIELSMSSPTLTVSYKSTLGGTKKMKMVGIPYLRLSSLHYMHVQPAVPNVSIFALEHKGYVRRCEMGPRDGAVEILADSMGVLGDIDTYVSRHGRGVERL
jgi:hypothetical protein